MYKWKPSKSARKEFAIKMQNPIEKAAYEQSKAIKADKRRSSSKFDYEIAGGMYVPTKSQHDFCMSYTGDLTPEQKQAFNMVMSAWGCNDKVDHDSIHIVNELIRKSFTI